jgi:hypothetical protein
MTETVEAEVVEEHGQEIALATIRVTPEQAKEAVDNIRAVIESVLQEGRDYMKIPGTKQPSLLKPGAEALQRFFGLGCEIQETEIGTFEGGEFFARVRIAIKNREGMTLGESDGWADATESKWKKAPRNTIIAMAHKRGYVSAIRTATGTSDFFTDSIEDHQPAVPVVEDQLPSDTDKLALAKLYAQKKPATIEEGAAWIASYPDKAQSRAWVARQALNLLTRPDPLPIPNPVVQPTEDQRQVPDPEPDIPVEIPGQTSIDEAPTETIDYSTF